MKENSIRHRLIWFYRNCPLSWRNWKQSQSAMPWLALVLPTPGEGQVWVSVAWLRALAGMGWVTAPSSCDFLVLAKSEICGYSLS